MSIDGWQPTAGAVSDRRRGLERDWCSVLAGAGIVGPVCAYELQVPR